MVTPSDSSEGKSLKVPQNPMVVAGVKTGKDEGGVSRCSSSERVWHERYRSRWWNIDVCGLPVFKRRRGKKPKRGDRRRRLKLASGNGHRPTTKESSIGRRTSRETQEQPALRSFVACEVKTPRTEVERFQGRGWMDGNQPMSIASFVKLCREAKPETVVISGHGYGSFRCSRTSERRSM